jgi:hypothetical protein
MSIFICAVDKKFKIALVVFSVPYTTSVLSDLVYEQDDDTVTMNDHYDYIIGI